MQDVKLSIEDVSNLIVRLATVQPPLYFFSPTPAPAILSDSAHSPEQSMKHRLPGDSIRTSLVPHKENAISKTPGPPIRPGTRAGPKGLSSSSDETKLTMPCKAFMGILDALQRASSERRK